jgi:integrase
MIWTDIVRTQKDTHRNMNAATVIPLRPKSGAGKARTQDKERQKLTDAIIKRLPTPATGNKITYDGGKDAVKGFGIRVTAGGSRAFVLSYRTRAGRERRYTIGDADNWQTTAAREKAKELKRYIDDGNDPLGDIEAEREAPTVTDLIDRFEAEWLPRKRPGTATDYKRMLDKHVRPFFSTHTKVAEVTLDDHIEPLHRKISKQGHLRRANTVVAVLSKMFSLAVRWGMRADNPCKGVERHPEVKRTRYLKGDELARLLAALNKHDKDSANIFRMLLLTGARRGEVLAMRWADVDLEAGKWTKPGSTTKQRTEHEVPLSAPVRQLLAELRDAQSAKSKALPEFVFPGNGDSGHVVAVKRAWASLCKAAGISGLRIHDLRHSFASQLVSGGASLPLIGALLGHSNPTTTHRYAHLFDDPQRVAVERVGAVITAAGNGKPPTKRRSKWRRA